MGCNHWLKRCAKREWCIVLASYTYIQKILSLKFPCHKYDVANPDIGWGIVKWIGLEIALFAQIPLVIVDEVCDVV